jgi:hypothetical protein
MALFGAFVALARVSVTLGNFVGELLKHGAPSPTLGNASNNEKATIRRFLESSWAMEARRAPATPKENPTGDGQPTAGFPALRFQDR